MLLPSTTASKCQIYNFTDSTSRRSPPLLPRKAIQTSPKSHRSITNSLKSSAKRSRINYQSTAPGTFQHFVNDTFREYLDDFMVAYLDDLLIYSNTLKEHKQHVGLVLKRLKDKAINLKLSKSDFNVQPVHFLDYIIPPNGISMTLDKIN